MLNKEEILWKDVEIGDEFLDGSKVLSIHEKYHDECYSISYRGALNFKRKEIIVSKDHLLLCDISKLNYESKEWATSHFSNYVIPTQFDKHLYFRDMNSTSEKDALFEEVEVVKSDRSVVGKDLMWLPASAISLLTEQFCQKVYCNNKRINSKFLGQKEVFCVETSTNKFETCGLIHHNSVTLRSIIFHCLTHGEEIAVALIDLKYTEFTPYKGFKNVVAVANTVREAAEVMRVGREIMYKRNSELAELGLNDIANFRPKKDSGEVVVAGRRLKDQDTLEIKIGSEIKTVTVKELEQYL